MITNFFILELNNHDVQELWFQQNGATCHTACATIDLLKDTSGDRIISRFGPVDCPPRSCDLTPLDYFLCGNVKSLVYADKPQTLCYLEDNIRRVIADIRPRMLEKVIENWTSRLDYIRASRGSPIPEIIFKINYWSWVAWWLDHRTPGRKSCVRCSMSPNTLRVHTQYVLIKSVGPKVFWAESRVQGTGEYFSPIQPYSKIVEVEMGGVAIYCPFQEIHRANLYCHLYGA
ncbi:uncharacterized protein TNCV_3163691 [Trichonephila clavipes]|nr:uncharacterized protein TNCV_3163691 [Trichonephila clavipes]